MEGAKVYVQDEKSSAWRKATVIAALGVGKYRVELEPWEGDEDGVAREVVEVSASNLEGGTLPFQNSTMPEGGFPDMTTLDHLHEAALLHNLRVRFRAGVCPYTYTADIVIAVNPYKWLPELYTDEMRKEYLVFEKSKLTPHVYATSSTAYSDLQEAKVDQSILVSGESGAGKTETVKILMGHLALIASSDDTSVIERIVKSNPLLESFGNAQTVRNDNSSRFGKFIELELNGACRLVGSRCRTFLLEKSRVVGQDAGERNYHIFYQMLALDADRRASFGLGRSSLTRDSMRYTSLGKSTIDAIEGKSDAARFDETVEALALVNIKGEELTQLLKALAGVLLLGQLHFELSGDQTQENASIFKPELAEEVAETAGALSVESSQLEAALTQRTIISGRGERFVKKIPPESCVASRDAIAKELYLRVFDWLVARICAATSIGDCMQDGHTVGLLDIFGFESFAINRFEQLCINYANEKLQQKFTLDIFKAVQQEYTDEGIPWEKVEFKDNAPVLALIESKLGIIAMLNEECVRPKGSDENLVSKMTSVHREDPAYSTPRLGKDKEVQFSVRHYAGTVMYTTTGWLERNKDVVSDDLLQLMRGSSNSLVATVFSQTESTAGEGDTKGAKPSANTVATKFKVSLGHLMDTIKRTRTQYVRCIKPNKQKSATIMENEMVVDQLRCAGVVEAIRISRAGFPARMPLTDFSQRFVVLARAAAGIGFRGGGASSSSTSLASADAAKAAIATLNANGTSGADPIATCRAMMRALAPGEEEEYEIGRTRVYFKMGVLEKLEERRALVRQEATTVIASRERGRKARRRFSTAKRAALRLQSLQRMRRERLGYLRIRRKIVAIQAFWRAITARRYVVTLRRERAATRLQSYWRRRVAMRSFRRIRLAVVRVQAAARRAKCRRQYLIDLKEFKEQAKLENQVKALQAKLAAQEQAAMTAAEPPTEILEALQALKSENTKLRAELEKVKTENAELKAKNQELQSKQATRNDLVNFMQSQKKEEERQVEAHARRDRSSSEVRRIDSQGNSSPRIKKRSSIVRFHHSNSPFWADMPCEALPVLPSGTAVHVKFGQSLLLVDESEKKLKWQKPNCQGYRRTMSFYIERRSSKRLNSESEEPELTECVGETFTLRSVYSGHYVCAGGFLNAWCMTMGDKEADAIVFTFVPQEGLLHVGDASHLFALKAVGENKILNLRTDGYVSMANVAEKDMVEADENMAAAIEVLLPANTYEITIHEKLIGITVAKTMPLAVEGFKSGAAMGCPYEPGPAERTGRVHIGDIITSVNGRPLDHVAREEALQLINETRPVTLGFAVLQGDAMTGKSPVDRRRSVF